MPYPYAIEKIKKQRKQIDRGVFFVCSKYRDIDRDITKIIEFQIFYIQSLGIHADVVINIEDALAKSHALGIKKFVYVKVDKLIDWNENFLKNLLHNINFKTAIGNEDFFCAYTDYIAKSNIIKFEFEISNYNKFEILDILLGENNYFKNQLFHYQNMVKKIKDLKIKSIYLPWEGKKTLKLLDDFKSYQCEIRIYHETPIEITHEKIKEIIVWNLFTEKSKISINSYFTNLKKNSLYSTHYFDTGCNFVNFNKAILFSAEKRSSYAKEFFNCLKNANPSVVVGGVFPWGAQVLYDIPDHQNWMHFPWYLAKY